MILLLLFVVGVWLWQNHFARPVAPDDPLQAATSLDLALRKVDRDLRLADASRHLPGWVRGALDIRPVETVVNDAVGSLPDLARSQHQHGQVIDAVLVSAQAEFAYAVGVLMAVQQGGDPAAAPFAMLGLAKGPDEATITARIIRGEEYWWDLPYLRSLGSPGVEQYANLVQTRSSALVGRTVIARGLVVAIALGGLVFLPGTLLAFARAKARPARPRYPSSWQLSFGLAVFLLVYLASLGLSLTFNQTLEGFALQGAAPLPMPVFVAIDSLTRLIPAFLALGLLFRRCRHAISRLGIGGPVDGRLVLGGFAILMIADFGLRMAFPAHGNGSLSLHDAGLGGLVFGLASACFAAPLAEEILYRGVLFRSLANRIPLFPAALASSLLFAFVHFYSLPGLLLIVAVGMVCAYSFAASRALATAILLHALYNASVKIPEWIVYHAPLS
ncbi:MAG: CPBP family intramembrane metalloprotease [Akkermansiaceae bacterium]|nr:CPBP family intramembrane metalloprotease [Akkermansiaceae bacterium]